MDINVCGLAKLLMRGRRINDERGVTFASYEKDEVLACEFFRNVVRPLKYTPERKGQFAELLVHRAKQLHKHVPLNVDKKDERYLHGVAELEKSILKFLRTYPPRYTKITYSNA